MEQAFAQWRSLLDAIEVVEARGAEASLDGVPRSRLESERSAARAELEKSLSAIQLRELRGEDARAFALVRRVLAQASSSTGTEVAAEPAASASSPSKSPAAATPDQLAAQGRKELYAAFGATAFSLRLDGETLDRLTILGRLSREEDADVRRRLFFALSPLWQTVNGDGSPTSPYRKLLALSGPSWRKSGPPSDPAVRALGLEPKQMEAWLISVLEAWRDSAAEPVEPWDCWRLGSRASRELSPLLPREKLLPLTLELHRSIGADLEALGVHFDLDPRPGKTPVAFTTFGSRLRSEPWIFATYREGGFDNLVELLHEAGHALHLAAIRTRPAFRDWPDADPFTEAIGDLLALEAHEPEWQQLWLGRSVPVAESIRARYASVMLDLAWALFELKLQRNPTADPNFVWTGITSRYLKIRPHPELSWWALRGQLVEAPGYMMNYAAGAIVAADLRARVREVRGSLSKPDAGLYPWLSEHLLRFGAERATRDVLVSFLGRPPAPEALVRDLQRAAPRRE